jgi:uncharacterized protein YutE (UPF0331/DUF86 family)
MTKFRNLLVHLYWKVEERKVFQILKTDIPDIKEYVKEIIKLIAED